MKRLSLLTILFMAFALLAAACDIGKPFHVTPEERPSPAAAPASPPVPPPASPEMTRAAADALGIRAPGAGEPTPPPADPVEHGRQLANNLGCLACHSIDGSRIVGPTWLGLYGRTVTLVDGTTVVADEAYLVESIREPGAKIVQGYPNAMPPFPDLADDQINAIIEYIRTLQ